MTVDRIEDVELPRVVLDDLLCELRKRFVMEYAMTDDVAGMTSKLVDEIRKGEGLATKWKHIDIAKVLPMLDSFELGAKDEKTVYFTGKDLSAGGIEDRL